ncbi:MAG: EAL domain-containing protein [Lachnospiraceae bacterium]|nr:EAL domain-containing protein [Lachnospiraceae bacterium]
MERKSVLIVDDLEINRRMLRELLSNDLNVLEASDAESAISIIDRKYESIAVVLLDLIMPEQDGFVVLEHMYRKRLTEEFPVIIVSANDDDANVEKAFNMGAIDYISRPFANRILLRRVLTTVSLFDYNKDMAAEIDKRFVKDEPETDERTGLYTRNKFNELVAERLKKAARRSLCMIAIDIDHFKLFNRFYGREKGDAYLKILGEELGKYAETYNGIAGYFGGDNFALLAPNRQDILGELKKRARDELLDRNLEVGYCPKLGVYAIEDNTEAVLDIVDHAFTALSSIRTDYTRLMVWYNQDMVREVRDEFVLLSDIERGIRNGEFTFYVQPKCNMLDGRIVGGEALIRWNHRERGLVPPGMFIPALEKNGFITRVDQIVWEEVCKWQRKWIDDGHEPLPISVNVSRNDIFSMDFTGYFLNLMEKYHLPTHLIELEITESAYMEEYERFETEIRKLHTAGFSILMDDFGSGYSSLNSLKDLDIDVLKIDMKFLRIDYENKDKGISILESMVNMAVQLMLPIVVEGVETQDQVKFLTEMGCLYAQGYYYYRPLAVEEFERLIMDDSKVDFDGMQVSSVDQVHMLDFSEKQLFSDEMMNNILGAVAFYEVKDDTVKLLRLNEQYYRMMDMEYVMADPEYATHLRQSIHPDDRGSFLELFDQAEQNPIKGSTADIRYMKDGDDMRYIRFRIYPLRKQRDSMLYYGSLEDITDIINS